VEQNHADFVAGDTVLLANFLAAKLVIKKVEQNVAITLAQSTQRVFDGFLSSFQSAGLDYRCFPSNASPNM
jgi:hypothetical protein